MSNEMKDWLRENELEKEQEQKLKPIKPPKEQTHTTFFDGSKEKSHALPFTKTGLSYDYWKI